MPSTPYYPLYVLRSDGKATVFSSATKKHEPNQPTPDQLDDKPDAKGISDFYRKLDPGDPKEEDWRRKLGGMLMRELGGPPGRNYILAELPEHYTLYEHLKITAAADGTVQKSSRNHAKGSSERQDAYLYGHPLGRKKRYRSPGDFFPHLLWLVTDKHGDPDNCACKICCPEDLQPGAPAEAAPVNPATESRPEIKKEGSKDAVQRISSSAESPAQHSLNTAIGVVHTSQPIRPASQPPPPSKATPLVTQSSVPRAANPTPLPSARSLEQDLDSQYNQFMFRPGELVWFNRGPAWGLGVLARREYAKDPQASGDRRRYLVQPLSHPFAPAALKMIPDEGLLRPWLAWSAPGPTHPGLATSSLTYGAIDWNAVLQGHYGHGDAEVDASIFAAKTIDSSFTPFSQISTGPQGEIHYNGIFLGAEKIWCGEAVRLRNTTGTAPTSDILVLHAVIERSRHDPNTNQPSSIVYVVGDHYSFSSVAHDPNRPIPENLNLPLRVREDLKYRNSVTIPAKGVVGYWKLVRPLTSLNLTDVRGRWYESSLLLPILRGTVDFNNDLQRGEITDAGLWMNGRGDASGTVNMIGPKLMDRHEAFGAAVPRSFRISQGLDGPPEEPLEQGHGNLEGLEHMSTVDAGQEEDLDQFMNLDHVDQDGYMAQYGGNGTQPFT